MQKENQLFEDLARLLSSVAGTVAGAGREAETRLKEKLREAVGGLDLVSREEFEAVKALAANARAEVDALRAEVAALKTKTGIDA
jgi:BMFP domain-containing protein YqiC